MNELKNLLTNLHVLYAIPIHCYIGSKLIYYLGKDLKEFDPFITDNQLFNKLLYKSNAVYLQLENEKILYGICQNGAGTTCIIGPISFTPLSACELNRYKNDHSIIKNNNFNICNGSIVKTAAVLALIHKEMNHEEIDINLLIDNLKEQDYDKVVQEKDIINHDFKNSENKKEHTTYNEEKVIMTAFAKGDLDTLNQIMKTDMFERVGQMAITPFKQMEYTAISGITIFCRAAIEGGVNPDEAYKVSELYMQKIALSKTELELREILKNITIHLCKCVKRANENHNKFLYIEQTKNYVARNLYNRFTLNDIADAVGINKCYLTNQFTKQEGKTLKTYIQEERIKAAQNMLKYSDQSISVIANYLCFDSQSHFGSVFKKITGITPSQYRAERKPDNFWPIIK